MIAGEVDFLSPAVLHEVERICRKRQIDLTFLPRMIGVSERQSQQRTSGHLSKPRTQVVLSFAPPRFFRLKRWIDVVGSLVLIVLAFPLLLIGGRVGSAWTSVRRFSSGRSGLAGRVGPF